MTMGPPLRWTCRRLRAALVDVALDGAAPADRARVEAHTAGCAACRDALGAIRRLSNDLAVPALAGPGEDFWRRQRQSILRRVRRAPAAGRGAARWSALRVGGAVTAVVLALVVSRSGLSPTSPSLPQAVDHLDDDALIHLHDILPVIAPGSTLFDADGDLLSVHDLGDDDLDRLADMLGGSP